MSRAKSPLRGRMIFNVGARRSGTYWLQRVVTEHPAIAAVPSETHLFLGVEQLYERIQHGARSSEQVGAVYVEPDALLDATRDLCDTIFATHLEPGAEYLAERTALHALQLGLIDRVYPDARVIHIIRDGRDAVRSLAAQDFGPSRIADAAREWRDSIEAARAAGLPPARYREVRYEELLADPESTVGELFEWLGVASTPAIVEQAVAESRARANVDRFGIGGVASGKWQESFSPSDLAAFEEVAGELRAALGYPEGTARRPAHRRGSLRSRLRRPHPRAAVRRALRRLRPAPAEADERGGELNLRQIASDRLLACLRARDLDGARRDLQDSVAVAIVTANGRREARGEAGIELLGQALAEDPVLGGRQVIGDVHASPPTITYMLSLEHGGRRHDRVIVTVLPGPDRRVARLTIYRLPLGT